MKAPPKRKGNMVKRYRRPAREVASMKAPLQNKEGKSSRHLSESSEGAEPQ